MVLDSQNAGTKSPSSVANAWRAWVLVLSVALSITPLLVSSTATLAASGASLVTSSPAEAQGAQTWVEQLSRWLAPAAHWTDGAAVQAVLQGRQTTTNADRLRPRPKPGAFSMNLYRNGDFVSQQTEYWCVAASVQTMMNIIDDGKPRRSAKLQKRLHFKARDLDRDGDEFWRKLAGPSRWRKGLHGLGLDDWADMLTTNGYGRYEIERAPSLKKAVRMAARAIRATGRPAGLVVWRGAHAWVMSGFSATADPAYSDDFAVKKAFIQDPWYPRVSSIWGPSRAPNSPVAVKHLSKDFLRYNRPARRQPMRDGKYLLILPRLTPEPPAR
jgi:hypothetical protein